MQTQGYLYYRYCFECNRLSKYMLPANIFKGISKACSNRMLSPRSKYTQQTRLLSTELHPFVLLISLKLDTSTFNNCSQNQYTESLFEAVHCVSGILHYPFFSPLKKENLFKYWNIGLKIICSYYIFIPYTHRVIILNRL